MRKKIGRAKLINVTFGLSIKNRTTKFYLLLKALLYVPHFVLQKASWGPKRVILIP